MERISELSKQKLANKLRKESYLKTKTCYILGCREKPIKSHSIAESRLLSKISDGGMVIHYSTDIPEDELVILKPIGKDKATTFPGFCSKHDGDVFQEIDQNPYVPGNKLQEFLFALRAASREYTVRKAADNQISDILSRMEAGDREAFKEYGIELNLSQLPELQEFMTGFSLGTKDLESSRAAFNASYQKENYWKIKSVTLELSKAYPIVVSGNTKLEMGPDGEIINDIPNLRSESRPFYLTLFPQDSSTFAILSWMHKDDPYYKGMVKLNELTEEEKKITLSNIICSNFENFAVNPTYWNNIPIKTRQDFFKQIGASSRIATHTPLILNKELNIFV